MGFTDTAALHRDFTALYDQYEGPVDSFFDWVEEAWDTTTGGLSSLVTGEDTALGKQAKVLDESDIFNDQAVDTWDMGRGMGYSYDEYNILKTLEKRLLEDQVALDDDILDALQHFLEPQAFDFIEAINQSLMTAGTKADILTDDGAANAAGNIDLIADDLKNLTGEIYEFGAAREELFFGGKYGNVTGSLYKQVVKQGVGVLYNKMDIVMSNNFHGFFNEKEAADKIMKVLNERAGYLMAPGSGA